MITFSNWTIRNSGDVLARQYDHLSRTLLVSGVPDGYSWRMLVRAGGSGEYFDIIALFPMENGVGAVLTRDQLSVSGDYEMQLQGTLKADGETVCHSNTILVNIPPSMTGDAKWPAVPSEFTQIERRVQAQAELAEESSNTAVSAMNTAVKASNTAVSAKEVAVKAQLTATTAESMAKAYAESAGEASAEAFNSKTVASQAAETATNESSLASAAASNADDAAARAEDSAGEAAASAANAKASADAAAASAAQAAESAGSSGSGGNGGNIFVAAYGVTTTDEIYAAYQAGKAVFCNYNGMLASLYTIERTDEAVFLYHTDAGMYSITADLSGWSYEYRSAVDATLTKSGRAADAKAVGDAIGALSEEIAELDGSAKTYVQAEEPTDAAVGTLWYDTDEFAEDDTSAANEKLTFTGAVEAEYDGTAPVTVKIPVGGSGGGYRPLTLLHETTVEADTTSFSQEIPACDVVELHILNYSATNIPGDTFHKVCPNRKSDGAAVANYPIKLPSTVTSGGAMEAVYRFERHEGFINLFCWISSRNSGNGNSARSVQFQTMWDNSRFGGSASFAYTDKIDFINFTGLTLASGVIIQIYGQKQEG